MQNSERQDLYTRVTAKIVASLEEGVRPWIKPWSEQKAAARITRPLRHNGTPYSGINTLMLWGASLEHGFTSPIWMTFRQAVALKAHVHRGEKGSLVVYANTFTRTEENAEGQEIDCEISFLKGYIVFNVEQIDGLPEHYYANPEPRFTNAQRVEHADAFFAATSVMAVVKPTTHKILTTSKCRLSRVSATARAFMGRLRTRVSIARSAPRA